MKFENAAQVKKWLRLLPVAKKEMKAKIELYNELITDFTRFDISDRAIEERLGHTYSEKISAVESYRQKIKEARDKFDNLMRDWERLSQLLDSEELTVVTEKYLRGTSWTAMEFVVFYSRRQCFRILDRAAEKLVGQTVSGDGNV